MFVKYYRRIATLMLFHCHVGPGIFSTDARASLQITIIPRGSHLLEDRGAANSARAIVAEVPRSQHLAAASLHISRRCPLHAYNLHASRTPRLAGSGPSGRNRLRAPASRSLRFGAG